MSCIGNPPGPGWVCQDGGWLPPGHPAIRVKIEEVPVVGVKEPPTGPSTNLFPPIQEPDGPNRTLIQMAHDGLRLPEGPTFFHPPLILRDVHKLVGNRSVLRPSTIAPGPLIIIEKTQGGDYSIGYPLTTLFEDLRIVGFPGQTGLVIRGGVLEFNRVTICNCMTGARFDWAVNVEFSKCLFTGNDNGAIISGLPGVNSVTTLAFHRTRFAMNKLFGVKAFHAMGLLFDNHSVFEGNDGIGLYADPMGELDITLRDVWFEANRMGDILDPKGVIRYEGSQRRH